MKVAQPIHIALILIVPSKVCKNPFVTRYEKNLIYPEYIRCLKHTYMPEKTRDNKNNVKIKI